MKIVINNYYGGFGLNEEFINTYYANDEEFDVWSIDNRTDVELIAHLEEFGLENAEDGYCTLKIVEIPNEATDYMINEYDGWESVIYVLDGKIYEA